MSFNYLAVIVIVLSIVMIILSGIIMGTASKLSNNTEKDNIRNSALGLLIISFVVFLAGIFLFLLYKGGYSSSINRSFFF